MSYLAWLGPAENLVPLVGYLGGTTRITALHGTLISDSLDVRVSASSQVGHGDQGTWTVNFDSPMYLVRSNALASFIFARFTLNIPQGATITNAIFSLYQAEIATYVSTTDDRTIGAVQSDNAAAPTNASTMEAAAGNLGTTANWTNSGSFSNQQQLPTGDISAVIQQIVNRSGWQSGNSIVLVATHPGSGSKTHQQRGFDATEAYRPRLQVDFSYMSSGGVAPSVRNVTNVAYELATTHSVEWGAGAADDVLVMLYNGAANQSYTLSLPSGWASLYDVTQGDLRARAAWRPAPSASSGSTNVTLNNGSRFSAQTYRIQGVWDGGLLETAIAVGGAAGGTSTGPNPGSLSVPWGTSQPSLILAVSHSAAGGSVSYPSGYTDGTTAYTGVFNSFHARTSSAITTVTAASEDPGAFTLGDSVAWRAATIAIRGR